MEINDERVDTNSSSTIRVQASATKGGRLGSAFGSSRKEPILFTIPSGVSFLSDRLCKCSNTVTRLGYGYAIATFLRMREYSVN